MRIKELASYVMTGGVGFLVDGGIFSALLAAGFGIYESRAISFPLAVILTWALNRKITFSRLDSHSRSERRRFSLYFLVQALGFILNLSVFIMLGMLDPFPTLPKISYLCAGALLSLILTYYLTSRGVFTL